MPIVDMQRRARELGRIRIGQQVTSKGKTRPEKLDRFRLTSASRPLLDKVAELYGGEVRPWTPANGGPSQFEVVTDATRLPVLVPPQPVSQYYELWSGGGCQRRCDGQRELLSDAQCLCDPDPAERECKPTTRLNVILRDVEGIGVWRLESHGYYAAVELPEVADFLAQTKGYVSAYLGLEERTAKREGKTQRWMVPTLEVDVTPAVLLAGGGAAGQLPGGETPAIEQAEPEARQLEGKGAATFSPDELDMARNQLLVAVSVQQLTEIWAGFEKHFKMPDELRQAAAKRAGELRAGTSEIATDSLPDADTMWQRVLAAVPEDWTSPEVEAHFSETTGVDAGQATSADMQRYLDSLGGQS